MTCAHVVNVVLKKVAGVESVDVSLNKGLATVKLKPGNTVTVQQLWQLLHDKGYTPKTTTILGKGEVTNVQRRPALKVAVTKQVLDLAPDPKNPSAYNEAAKRVGQSVLVQGVMIPGKDLKKAVPLEITQLK